MANPSFSTPIHNTNEPHNTLISINVDAQTPLKLTSSNYISWKLQFHTLFIGYDLLGYVDGSNPCPPATLTQIGATRSNPAHLLWIRQDQLILNAILALYPQLSYHSLLKLKPPVKHGSSWQTPTPSLLVDTSNRSRAN